MLGAQITAQELYAHLNKKEGDSILVDVRTPDEFSRGAIAGARNIPVDEITQHAAELSKYAIVYLYCLSGGRSELALAQLAAAGLPSKLYSLTSGLLSWRKEGLPLTA